MSERIDTKEQKSYKQLAEYTTVANLLPELDTKTDTQLFEFLDYLVVNKLAPIFIELLTKKLSFVKVLAFYRNDVEKIKYLIFVLLEYNCDRINFSIIINSLTELGLTDLINEFMQISDLENSRTENLRLHLGGRANKVLI